MARNRVLVIMLVVLLGLLEALIILQSGGNLQKDDPIGGYSVRWVEIPPPLESSFVSCQLALFGPAGGAPVGVECFETRIESKPVSRQKVWWSPITYQGPNQRCWAALMGLGSGDFVGVVCGR